MLAIHYSTAILGYLMTILFIFGSYGKFKDMDYGRGRSLYKYTVIFLALYLLYIITDNLILHVR